MVKHSVSAHKNKNELLKRNMSHLVRIKMNDFNSDRWIQRLASALESELLQKNDFIGQKEMKGN